MARGRKPKPTQLKILLGNPGKRPLNDQEPAPPRAIPDCPEHLAPEAKAAWERVTRVLDDMGLLTLADQGLVARWCVAWARWVKAEKKVQETGEVIASREGGVYQNPYLAVANKAMDQLLKLEQELGLTPSARARLKAQPDAGANQGVSAFARKRSG